MSEKKKCKCGAEMQESKHFSYVESFVHPSGYVENTLQYCPVHQEQLSRAIAINYEAYRLLSQITRDMHTRTEIPRYQGRGGEE